jgi:hypothetical protein
VKYAGTLRVFEGKPYFCSPAFAAAEDAKKEETGAVAQSVEQRTENPCVGGSIPPHTTTKTMKPTTVLSSVGFLFSPLLDWLSV